MYTRTSKVTNMYIMSASYAVGFNTFVSYTLQSPKKLYAMRSQFRGEMRARMNKEVDRRLKIVRIFQHGYIRTYSAYLRAIGVHKMIKQCRSRENICMFLPNPREYDAASAGTCVLAVDYIRSRICTSILQRLTAMTCSNIRT